MNQFPYSSPPPPYYPPPAYPPRPSFPLGRVITGLGAVLVLAAFFLPWYSFLFFQENALDLINIPHTPSSNPSQISLYIPIDFTFLWLIPIIGILALIGAILPAQNRAILKLLQILLGLLGLGFAIYYYIQFQGFLDNSFATQSVLIHYSASSFLGSGYWLANVGYLGIVGGALIPTPRNA